MKHVFSRKSNCSFLIEKCAVNSIAVKKSTCLAILFFLSIDFSLTAQTLAPFNPAKFGVDGDISSEERLQGTFSATGSHDWFKQNGQTGYGVFDTTGGASIRKRIGDGENYTFSKKMQYPSYSVQNGLLMLDGTYSRDYFGTSTIGNGADKTVFQSPAGNNKSSSNPSLWTTAPNGNSVLQKSDLIDSYIHMRRNGTSLSQTNPSNLFVYFAATTLSTSGNHFLDFELFKSDITYNTITGLFSNSGPAATGGRSTWEFDANGNIKTFGDMSLSFSFNNISVTEIAIYIWVPYAIYNTVNPTGFDFDKSATGWAGNNQNSGYGYARIIPETGKSLQAWGTVNQARTPAPVWGTNASEISSSTTNYFSTEYSEGQFAEAAIDLTSIGVDPALSLDYDRCAPPYVKVLVKSRSSSAFSSTLQDFVMPFAFLIDTQVPSDIALSNQLSCAAPVATLTATNNIQDANYRWSTPNGRIASGENSPEVVIDQPGEYTLSSAIYEGCPVSKTTITVYKDDYQPVAQASQTGILNDDPNSNVTLRGGDEAQSNYTTPFGGSQGLLWHWTGPNGYNSKDQNPLTQKEGTYQLVVTEKRNGCTDTANVEVLRATPLALTLQRFSGVYVNNRIQLNWEVEENESGSTFEVEKSKNGQHFSTIALLFATEKVGSESYSFKETQDLQPSSYYRLKMIDKGNKITYSKIIAIEKAQFKNNQTYLYCYADISRRVLHYQSDSHAIVTITIYDNNGRLLKRFKKPVQSGANKINLPEYNEKINGVLFVEIINGTQRNTVKI